MSAQASTRSAPLHGHPVHVSSGGASHRPKTLRTGSASDPGHWESDLLKVTFNRSCVGTPVVRKMRLVLLCKMDGYSATVGPHGIHFGSVRSCPVPRQ